MDFVLFFFGGGGFLFFLIGITDIHNSFPHFFFVFDENSQIYRGVNFRGNSNYTTEQISSFFFCDKYFER